MCVFLFFSLLFSRLEGGFTKSGALRCSVDNMRVCVAFSVALYMRLFRSLPLTHSIVFVKLLFLYRPGSFFIYIYVVLSNFNFYLFSFPLLSF